MPTFGELAPDLGDPFDVAAARLRNAVQPAGGRPVGVTTKILENYLPHMFGGLASLPQRATMAAGDLQRTGEYDAGPAIETAMLMAGARSPFVKPGEVGTFGTLAPSANKGEAIGIRAYHGSPYDFDRFDLSKIGTGEGAQAYGHGLYFAEAEPVAKSYKMAGPEASRQLDVINGELTRLAREMDKYPRKTFNEFYDPAGDVLKAKYDQLLEERTKLGRMYEVNIKADPAQMLPWDRALSLAHPARAAALDAIPKSGMFTLEPERTLRTASRDMIGNIENLTGERLYSALERRLGSAPKASAVLQEAGIPGIKYLDEGSRNNLAVLPDNPMTNEARKFLADAGGNTEKAGKLFRDSNPVERWAVPERDQIYGLIQKGGNKPTSNFVLFRDDIIDIMRKYGLAGLMGAGGLAAAKKGDGGT